MIKISKICDKNKNEFYDDVKESYLKLLNKIKKNEKKIYNIEKCRRRGENANDKTN